MTVGAGQGVYRVQVSVYCAFSGTLLVWKNLVNGEQCGCLQVAWRHWLSVMPCQWVQGALMWRQRCWGTMVQDSRLTGKRARETHSVCIWEAATADLDLFSVSIWQGKANANLPKGKASPQGGPTRTHSAALEELGLAHQGREVGTAQRSHAKNALQLALQACHVCHRHGCNRGGYETRVGFPGLGVRAQR